MTDSKALVIPDAFKAGAQLPAVFAGTAADSLGEGIRSGFGIIGYRGKVWSTKYQGNEKAMMRPDGDGPQASIEVVIVQASPSIAKIFYEGGWVDGSNAPPDCWSTDGVKPDSGAPKKQSPTCAGCPRNAWGSKVTDAGKAGKECSDSKRLAVTPLADMKNELMGGPMLLRVPAASLKDLKAYGDQMQALGYPYYAIATRIGFDHTESFPKFVFTPIRPLKADEAVEVVAMRNSPQVKTILSEAIEAAKHEPEAPAAIAKSPFEAAAMAQVAGQAVVQPAVQEPAKPAAAAQTATPASTPASTPVSTPASVPDPAASPATEPAGGKRKRRTKEEMAAAAAALAAARNGGAPVAAATGSVTPAAEAPAPAAAVAAETAPASEDFEAKLAALLG